MTDLVKRARELGGFSPEAELCSLMADEIERLRSWIDAQNVALNLMATVRDPNLWSDDLKSRTLTFVEMARAALRERVDD